MSSPDPLYEAPSPSGGPFDSNLCIAFEEHITKSETPCLRLTLDRWREIRQTILNSDSLGNLDKQGKRRKWTVLNGYFLKNRTLFKRPTVAQKQAGMVDQQVILDHELYDTIVTTHSRLLHAGKNKTYDAVNNQYYGIA